MTNPRRHLLYISLVTLTCGQLLAGGCSGIVRRSVRDGIFGYVSGTVGNDVGTDQLNALLSDILTGGFNSGTNNNL